MKMNNKIKEVCELILAERKHHFARDLTNASSDFIKLYKLADNAFEAAEKEDTRRLAKAQSAMLDCEAMSKKEILEYMIKYVVAVIIANKTEGFQKAEWI